MTRTTARTKIGTTRTHALALAVLTALGVSGLAQAQVEAPRPAAEEEARESRDDAVDAANAAKAAAESADAAATVADVLEDTPAPTVDGAVAADLNAAVAADAAMNADMAADDAADAAEMANAALKATEDGSNPIGTAQQAEAAEHAAHVAASGAINAAMTAEAAASATAQAVAPPPVAPTTMAVDATPMVPVSSNAQVVTVNSMPGNSISSNYKIDFDATDKNNDGVIVRSEVTANPDLQREFHVVDLDNNGQLTRVELQDWIDPLTLQ